MRHSGSDPGKFAEVVNVVGDVTAIVTEEEEARLLNENHFALEKNGKKDKRLQYVWREKVVQIKLILWQI